jgi:hypothetical protein
MNLAKDKYLPLGEKSPNLVTLLKKSNFFCLCARQLVTCAKGVPFAATQFLIT